MKKSEVFIGTVKKCNDIYNYKRCGECEFIDDFVIGHAHLGTMRHYVDVITEKAILIKVKENEFIWIDLIDSLKDKILINFGIAPHIIKTKPYNNYDYFVEKSTLKPLFKENINEDIKVKTLRKLID